MILPFLWAPIFFIQHTQLAVPAWMFSECSGFSLEIWGCDLRFENGWIVHHYVLFLKMFPIFCCCWNLKLGKELAQVQHGLVQLVKTVEDGVKQSGKLGEKIQEEKGVFFFRNSDSFGVFSHTIPISEQKCFQGMVSLLGIPPEFFLVKVFSVTSVFMSPGRPFERKNIDLLEHTEMNQPFSVFCVDVLMLKFILKG